MVDIESLIYRKYEQYSACYVVDLPQLRETLTQFYMLHPTMSAGDLNDHLDDLLKQQSYFNLLSDRVDNFETKIHHNLSLAKSREDGSYWAYLRTKFHLGEGVDLMSLDLSTWSYRPNKPKIKLKVPMSMATASGYRVSSQLGEVLGVVLDPMPSFKYALDIVRLVHKYICEHELQNVNHKAQIDPDPQLQNLLAPLTDQDPTYTYYNLPQYLSSHIIKN